MNLACTLCPGNPVYAAPEAMHVGGQQSCKMDVYSFGILLIEMLSCQLLTLQLWARLLQEIKWQEMYLLIETCIRAYVQKCISSAQWRYVLTYMVHHNYVTSLENMRVSSFKRAS